MQNSLKSYRNLVILLDELNRAALSSNNVLFPCLDDRRKLSIEVAGGKDIREINVHPEVTFIATANVGSNILEQIRWIEH